ncbi:MAG TPA: DUF3052 domain-containing protein [Actinomycetota bacterium]|nr:DUF3052 domain-containing protein [Actinomycetota bacterium]
MADGHRDYSGTPLWRKLGIREGARVLPVREPASFRRSLEALSPLPAGVRFLSRATKDVDVAVLFATRRHELEERFGILAAAMRPDGRLWVAWPKKAANVPTDLTFGVVQRHGLDAGLVDNKTASIDEVFQACQFVARVKDRPR